MRPPTPNSEEPVFGRRAVDLLILARFPDSPVKVLARDELGQADDGDPLEVLLVRVHAVPSNRSTARCLA